MLRTALAMEHDAVAFLRTQALSGGPVENEQFCDALSKTRTSLIADGTRPTLARLLSE